MKKAITVFLTASMLLSIGGCGKKEQNTTSHIVDGDPVVIETDNPAHETAAPTDEPEASPTDIVLETSAATLEPFTDSDEVTKSDSDDTVMKKKSFEAENVEDGYTKYISGDNKWGIVLPNEMQVGDESDTGVVFVYGSNMVAVSVMDEKKELSTPSEAREYASVFGDVNIDNFTVIYNGKSYSGCSFDYETEVGMRGFGKYAAAKHTAVCAVGVNMENTQEINEMIRKTVNSLVVFD